MYINDIYGYAGSIDPIPVHEAEETTTHALELDPSEPIPGESNSESVTVNDCQ